MPLDIAHPASLEQREDADDARDTDHRERTAIADARDVTLGQRVTTAELRDAALVDREAAAEGRNAKWFADNLVAHPAEALTGPLSPVTTRLRSLRSCQNADSLHTGLLDTLIVEVDRAFSMVMRTYATAVRDAAASSL